MMPIFVTKPFIPNKNKFLDRVSKVLDRGILTNQGPEVQELERHLKEYLHNENVHYLSNGTIALQFALRALDVADGEVITTPFTYVATTSAILWERCTPKFIDIEVENFTIDPSKIEDAITEKTKAIMPVHVFGYPCQIDKIEAIAKRHNIKVIYDAAHAFGSRYKGKSLASYGDISTLSFHATKLFHTLEGGACIVNDKNISGKIELLKKFGHVGDVHYTLGINGKQDEINAAMGNVNFEYIDMIIKERKRISELYDSELRLKLQRPVGSSDLDYNYAYFPVVFESEKQLINVFKELAKIEVFPRRYFYPSLNNLPYINKHDCCPNSEDISKRIACLPLYVGLDEGDIERIITSIRRSL